MNAKWKENVYKWKEDERTWMHIGMNMKGIGKENEWKCIPIKGTWQENERKWMHNERRMHAWKDLEYSDFHKTLESDRAPPKAITITLATTQRNLTGVHIYIYIYTCYIYICYVYIYIYIHDWFLGPHLRGGMEVCCRTTWWVALRATSHSAREPRTMCWMAPWLFPWRALRAAYKRSLKVR